MQRIKCGEIFGGIRGQAADVETSGLKASLYSSAADGGAGGDIYYFSVCNYDLLTRLAVLDVAGHGEAVSQQSERLFESLRERMDQIEGSEVLRDLNRRSLSEEKPTVTTGTVVTYYRETGDLYFANAGHPPFFAEVHDGTSWNEIRLPETQDIANLPLGVLETTRFDQGRIHVPSRSLLLLYTDGVLEARNAKGELFGRDGLHRALEDSDAVDPIALGRFVVNRLYEHAGADLTHDDVTLLAVEIG